MPCVNRLPCSDGRPGSNREVGDIVTRHGWIAFGVAGLYLAGARLPAWIGDPALVRVLLAMPVGLLVGLVAGRGARCLA